MSSGDNKGISSRRAWLARAIAIAADLLQIVVFPYFIEGLLSPIDLIMDLTVCVLLTLLVGWHIAFLPSIAAEIVPFADLAPTWTIAIFIATRRKSPKYLVG
jgi:hypothetical protein